jgi:hypothetical protein
MQLADRSSEPPTRAPSSNALATWGRICISSHGLLGRPGTDVQGRFVVRVGYGLAKYELGAQSRVSPHSLGL